MFPVAQQSWGCRDEPSAACSAPRGLCPLPQRPSQPFRLLPSFQSKDQNLQRRAFPSGQKNPNQPPPPPREMEGTFPKETALQSRHRRGTGDACEELGGGFITAVTGHQRRPSEGVRRPALTMPLLFACLALERPCSRGPAAPAPCAAGRPGRSSADARNACTARWLRRSGLYVCRATVRT